MTKATGYTLAALEDLRPADYNPRTIDADALQGLQRSLHEFGDISGFVWNQRTGNLVAGHQRLRALSEKYGPDLRFAPDPPRVVTPDATFPVRVVDWDHDREMAANVAANSPLLAGQFTDELADVLVAIDRTLPDLYDSLRLAELDVPGVAGGEEDEAERDETTGGPPAMELQPYEHYDTVLVLATNVMDWEWLCDFFRLERVNASALGDQKKIGLGRAVRADRVIARIKQAVAEGVL